MHSWESMVAEAKKQVEFDPKTKETIRKNLSLFMSEKPLSNPRSDQRRNIRTFFISSFFSRFNLKQLQFASIIAVVCICLGGGMVLAAEKTIPGDFLYIVKTDVNERVSKILSLSTESKARWEANQIKRRLEEVKQLTTTGQAPQHIAFEAAHAIQEHTIDADKYIEELKLNGKVVEGNAIATLIQNTFTAYQYSLSETTTISTSTYATNDAIHPLQITLPATSSTRSSSNNNNVVFTIKQKNSATNSSTLEINSPTTSPLISTTHTESTSSTTAKSFVTLAPAQTLLPSTTLEIATSSASGQALSRTVENNSLVTTTQTSSPAIGIIALPAKEAFSNEVTTFSIPAISKEVAPIRLGL